MSDAALVSYAKELEQRCSQLVAAARGVLTNKHTDEHLQCIIALQAAVDEADYPTEKMISAGVSVLELSDGHRPFPAGDRRLVCEVFMAMIDAAPTSD